MSSTCCAPYYTCSCCASFSYLHSSCSFRSCSFNSCNSFFFSSILCFSLCLCAFLLLHCCLFTSIANTAFCTSGFAHNLQLCSSSMLSTIFLLPLSCAGMFTSADGALLDASSPIIPQWCQLVHWAWRSYNNISMGLPLPNDMLRGSTEIVLSCSDILQNNVGHMDCSFGSRMDISWTPLIRHPHAWNYVSRITWSTTEEWAKVSSSFGSA